jgi:LmbE family N-acetylglucosaminyl deacetylase
MRILTVAAHPDDETLGAGGTMAWHASKGDRVWVCVLADGVTSRHGRVAQQAECAQRACEILGVERLVMVGLPDQRCIAELAPDVVLTHFPGDVNEDHRLVSRAVMVATRPVAGSHVRKVCAFEVPSSTDWTPPIPGSVFTPNLYVDISDTLDTKLTAMKAYADTYVSEVRPYPHPRSLEALTVYGQRHGIVAGMRAAEPFMLLRESANRGMWGFAVGGTL